MMLEIKMAEDKFLYQKAADVREDEFGAELDAKLSEMAVHMYTNRGVGLAGNQVGDLRRILVADLGWVNDKKYGVELIKMVNPKIIEYSDETWNAEEGCLSYPGLPQRVIRATTIAVEFLSPFGEKQVAEYTGWQARIIQHEMDHAEGITLYTRANSIKRNHYMKRFKTGKV